MTPILLFAFLLLAAASAYLGRSEREVRRLSLIFASLIAAGMLIAAFGGFSGAAVPGLGRWLAADAFTWLIVALIAFVYVTATIVSYRYVGIEHHEGKLRLPQVRLYYCLLHLFVLTMIGAVLADNLGVLWVSLEGTTLATTMLVAMYRKDASIEAAWKYIVLCSIGISLGLLGMLIFVHAAAVGAGISPADAFSLSALRAHAAALDPALVRWAFIFIFIGLGTKVGFFPMHTWLPDAHSKTPSPVSAMLSGILLNVALYAVLRFKPITDTALGSTEWTDGIFLAFGTLSVVAAAMFLLQQHNYKRMLAYSSMEHMGFMAVAIGLGPVGLAAALIHTIGHTIVKPMLFFGAGEFFLTYGSTKIDQVRDVMRRLPITGILFLLGILLILAVPPSALFTSEFWSISVMLHTHPWFALPLVISLSIIALGMLKSVAAMFYSAPHNPAPARREHWNLTHGVMIVQLILAIGFGLFMMTHTGPLFLAPIITALTPTL